MKEIWHFILHQSKEQCVKYIVTALIRLMCKPWMQVTGQVRQFTEQIQTAKTRLQTCSASPRRWNWGAFHLPEQKRKRLRLASTGKSEKGYFS